MSAKVNKVNQVCFTKKQLAKAFDKWNREYDKNPDSFTDIDLKDNGVVQAEALLDYLKDVK